MTCTRCPAGLRADLAAAYRFGTLVRTDRRQADGGLTDKALHALDDGRVVESVLMRYPARGSRRERDHAVHLQPGRLRRRLPLLCHR